jgi:AAA domain, putative AbiEii toxin, Type IV TA system
MLESLELKNLGPSPEMKLSFGERLNLLTGDNGLGKTFVLDTAWWALTRTWAEGRMLLPDPRPEVESSIAYEVRGKAGLHTKVKSKFDFAVAEDWKLPRGKKPMPGLVVYARVDGGFSVWDPARNYWRETEQSTPGGRRAPLAYHFNRRQIWNGLWQTEKDEYEKNRQALICRGLIEDVVSWQHDPEELAARSLLASVVAELSPQDHPGGRAPLAFGPPGEMLGRTGKVPMLKVSYSVEPIPLEQASAGIRRIVAMAYALVWAWVSHRKAVTAKKGMVTAAHQIVFLFDEIEAHLHPRWQRLVLPALLRTLGSLGGPDVPVQAICTTHAPLVLASVETEFYSKTDRLFNFEQKGGGRVEVEEVQWAKFGDASGWLTSPAFGMDSGYSQEAETAMKAADDLMAGYLNELPAHLRNAEQIHAELRRTLDGGDPYWPLWLPYYRQQHNKA